MTKMSKNGNKKLKGANYDNDEDGLMDDWTQIMISRLFDQCSDDKMML